MMEKGIDGKQAITVGMDALSFNMLMNDGSNGLAFIFEEEDGYCRLSCLTAYQSRGPFDQLLWFKLNSLHDLIGSEHGHDGTHYGCSALRIKPQSVDELRQDLSTFVTRVGLAVEAFRKAEKH